MTPALRAKLAKVCGLLASPHDGERATAALMATKLLRDAGLTWADVFAAPPVAAPPSCWAPATPPPGWTPPAGFMDRNEARSLARQLMGHVGMLTASELHFLLRMAGARKPPKLTDAAALRHLADQVRRRSAGARQGHAP